ncbi:MAG: hypothetical protein ACOYMA_19690 [Bacteroidia bacterium]
MKYILEIAENKSDFAEEFFKTISFIKNVKAIPSNEITNPTILQNIEAYEKGKIKVINLK